jgi:hypothetical protein
MDPTIRIKLLTIDSITLLNRIFDANRVDNLSVYMEVLLSGGSGSKARDANWPRVPLT